MNKDFNELYLPQFIDAHREEEIIAHEISQMGEKFERESDSIEIIASYLTEKGCSFIEKLAENVVIAGED